MNCAEVSLRASVARNFCWASLSKKGTVNQNTEVLLRASVARNFYWALLSKKGTVK